ncbi:UNVERIFIED_CONTAM: hypothetical protein GTU68_027537 [Idotea baltica]|nr:hypothetical protein [Idotea baltica]
MVFVVNKPFIPSPKEVFDPIVRFALATLVVLSLSRLALVALYWSRVEAVDGLYFVLLQGVRFDLIVVCALALPPILLLPFQFRSIIVSRAVRVYLLGAFVAVIFMEAATPTFISEYDQRPNILFVEYLKYPKEVGRMLWVGYKLDIAVGLLVVAMLGVGLSKFLPAPRARGVGLSFPLAAVYSVTALFLCIVGVRSSFGHRPANPAKVAFSQDLLVNDFALSSLYSVAYASYSARRHESKPGSYGRMKMAKVIRQVQDDLALPGSDFISPELPTLHESKWVVPLDKPLNLVIILQESLGAEFVGALGGTPVTPYLDTLAEEGIWFDNLYATGTRSVRGIEAVTTGFTPTQARSVVKLPKSQTGFFTIAELLGRRGYDTSFIYGGEAHFDNMRQFFVGNGFQRVIEEKDFENPGFKGSWGVSDEDLFAKAHKDFGESRERPFFSLVFTSSNHSPFEFPEGNFELYEQPRATVNNAVKYADYAMGKFFEQAKQSSYWKNTLFLVVADHNSRVRGANLVPIEYFHIPALVLGGSVTPQTYSRMASQIDLLPTLLGLMGIDSDHPATGHDLFRPDIADIPGRAIMQYNATQAYMQDEQVVIMEADKSPALYTRTEAGLVPSQNENPALLDRALAYSIWSSTAYNDRLYRLPDR